MADSHIGEYEVVEQLGRGTFGSVVKAFHRKTLEKVAIKIESKHMSKNLFLMMEHENLRVLQGPGLPKLIDFFSIGENNYLVIELLGPNLYQRFTQSSRKFSDKTVLMIADQALTRIELVHNKSFIHRDIKPENFVTGLNSNQNQLYLIDFGLSKKYFNESCGLHIPYKEDKAFAGTLEFASRNCHKGVQMSRRDDLESLMYMVIYLFKGKLPWLDSSILDKNAKNARVRVQKTTYSPVDLTQGLPWEIREMLKYVLALNFDETPDYDMLRRHLRHAAHSMEIRVDWQFDWMPQESVKSRRKSELPLTFIQSIDSIPAPREKRNSLRAGRIKTKAGKESKSRDHTCMNVKRMMMSAQFERGQGAGRRIANRTLTEHPQQPSSMSNPSDDSDGSEHLTVKETVGPVFKNRDRILRAASEHGKKSNCSLF